MSLAIEFGRNQVVLDFPKLINHQNRARKMSTSVERRLEEIQRLLDNLTIELSRGTPIIVEGKKDAKALKELKISGETIYAKTSGKTFLDVVREIEETRKNEVILLMDFDSRGREWTRRLADYLERMKVRPNLVFWRRLSSLVGRDIEEIEGLSAYIQTLKRKIGRNILDMEQ